MNGWMDERALDATTPPESTSTWSKWPSLVPAHKISPVLPARNSSAVTFASRTPISFVSPTHICELSCPRESSKQRRWWSVATSTRAPAKTTCAEYAGTFIRGARRVGGRLEARLASGRRVRGPSPVSSGSDSSSDDGECARRAGGSVSPGAMVRVGGGGSLPFPRNLRSLEDVRSVGNAPIMLWRVAREGGV